MTAVSEPTTVQTMLLKDYKYSFAPAILRRTVWCYEFLTQRAALRHVYSLF